MFLTASAEERAERRYKQLKEKGFPLPLHGLLREILARDARDANRAVAPLRPAGDAVRIDTTGLPIEDVVARVLAVVHASWLSHRRLRPVIAARGVSLLLQEECFDKKHKARHCAGTSNDAAKPHPQKVG